MNGVVDELGRALVPIRLKQPAADTFVIVHAWIDTGFTGELMLPKAIVTQLAIPRSNVVKAELGDGSAIVLATFECTIDWFGEMFDVEALESNIDYPLLGVGLLNGHQLSIDYEHDQLSIT